MRFEWDGGKDQLLRKKWGFGFEQAKEVFSHPLYESQKDDDPEQYRAIGWCELHLISVIYEEREDEQGTYYWLVTFWRAVETERRLYEEG